MIEPLQPLLKLKGGQSVLFLLNIKRTEKIFADSCASSRSGRHRIVLSLHPEVAVDAAAESVSWRLQRMVSILHLEASTSTGEENPEERAKARRRLEPTKGRPDLATRQSSTLQWHGRDRS